DGRGAPAARARPLLRGRSPGGPWPLRLRARHLRGGRRVPSRGRGRVRPAVGSLGRDVGPPAADGGADGPARRPTGADEVSAQEEARPLWHGRFGEGPADALMERSGRLPFGRRLAHDDLVGSRAHVDMLASVGLLTEEERFAIADALDRVGAELNDGTFAFVPSDEDIHTAIERRVTEIAGAAGA